MKLITSIKKKLKNARLYGLSLLKPKKYSYWEDRYRIGLDSGEGSYGKYAQFKADVINDFIKKKKIKSAIELGCGDGNQISLINYPTYVGLDISRTTIKRCISKFQEDNTKSFFIYDSQAFADRSRILSCDLSLSLDVIYHILEYPDFKKYMNDLFSTSNKFVIIYSTNHNRNRRVPPHIRHWKFSDYVEKYFPDWALENVIPTIMRHQGHEVDFYIYRKKKLT